ncbi:MAG: PHP domain-containing protein [Candidatus Delongbacteria bacterium]|nr:PHP domain-containing protein [Candidatus Delongbacteria bacterium]MBN2834948.1 PHP domain-containing protein [Candidatus Delongbacteria bacterium]
MKIKADLHIHSVLSPCGDLDMSPKQIINTAISQGLNMIAITDHNSTIQAQYMISNNLSDIKIIGGTEFNSSEDIHGLSLFENIEQLKLFQDFLDKNLQNIPNKPDKFGYQVAVDFEDNIFYEEEKLLITALKCGVKEIYLKTKELGGYFIFSHIDRNSYSVLSQLGFIPDDITPEAVEISASGIRTKFKYLNMDKYKEVSFSDAHYISDIGKTFVEFEGIPDMTSFIQAIKNSDYKIGTK